MIRPTSEEIALSESSRRVFRALTAATMATLLIGTANGASAETCAGFATVVSVQGTVQAKTADRSQWQPVGLRDTYCPGDVIRVGDRSRADLMLADQSVLRLREGTELVVDEVEDKRSYIVDLLQGAVHFFSRSGARELEVQTPFTVAGVRGTEFSVDVTADSALVRVFEGSVLAANSEGSLMLTDGQTAMAKKDMPPTLRVEARPRDAVRWALYYEPVVYPSDALRGGNTESRRKLARSAEAYRAGDVSAAFAAIDGVAVEQLKDPRVLVYRASLSLGVGRVEEAERDIERALALSAGSADALALRTVIALAAGDEQAASAAAEAAVEAQPESAAAQIALSYAEQARFDLKAALAALERAVAAEPDNPLAWARLAELRAAVGDHEGAMTAANESTGLDPRLARAQTVLGFAALNRVEVDAASEAFERAVELDSADPLPRLGLGLAKIRSGDLNAGARDIEAAASLDSSNALVRSYLGKAYFEEKREGLDEREYETAKQLDPNDPTPWFYEAISKQMTNRPVEALRSLRKAIELNDNRAVYRSRLLLDSDLAARSASLGRIYGDLGFQQLALVEGWNSVNADPTNYSAHRLLADSYAALPRHEIARVSALLKSQLLQPSNMTPIQPRLAESNLFLLSSQGPSTQSFNEFNPLFNRNQVGALISGMAGEDETWAGEGIVSGIEGKLSFSGGYSGYWTDGFRTNNDQDDDIANLFLQYEFGPDTSMQTELRYRDYQNGDLELRFLKDDFSQFQNEETETYSGRVGLRHQFAPGSIALVSFIHQENKTKFNEFVPDPMFGDFAIDLDIDQTGDTFETQYLWRSDDLGWFGGLLRSANTTVGVGHASVNSKETSTTQFGPFPPEVTQLRPDVKHTNLYLYTDLALGDELLLTLGASRDMFEEQDGQGKKNRGNPKFGLTWNPQVSPGTTVRAAAFRTLTRTLITQATLEPTQVAGFNQFFDEPPGTESWRYGVGLDQELSENLYSGVELSMRDLEVPTSVFGSGNAVFRNLDWEEYLARTYLFWTPHDWVSARVEYAFERFERDEDSLFAFKNVNTHRVPFGVLVSHPCGASVSLGATYMNQEGDFLRNSTATYESGDRDFWVVDTGLRYRLPKRRGFVSFGVNNLFDEDATYQATDVRNPSLRPGRFIFGSVTLAIP